MVHVLPLQEKDFAAAIAIKGTCWSADYGAFAPAEGFRGPDELAFLRIWGCGTRR